MPSSPGWNLNILMCLSSWRMQPSRQLRRCVLKKRGAMPQWRINVILPNSRRKPWRWTFLLPLALLIGCGLNSTRYVAVSAPAVPILPSEARVSRVSTPSVCSSTCSKGWSQQVEKSLNTLTE